MVASDDVDSLAREIVDREAERRAVEADIDRCLADLGAAREDVLTTERVLDEARSDVHNLRHELASLEAQQRAALGRDEREARDWLAEQGLDGAERLGEVLAVVSGWERAVESVLGDYLQAIHVERIDDFEAALGRLDQGGVTLVEGHLGSLLEILICKASSTYQRNMHCAHEVRSNGQTVRGNILFLRLSLNVVVRSSQASVQQRRG